MMNESKLANDFTRRNVVARAIERFAASTTAMGRFETEILSQPKNLELLMNLAGEPVPRGRNERRTEYRELHLSAAVPGYSGTWGRLNSHPSVCVFGRSIHQHISIFQIVFASL